MPPPAAPLLILTPAAAATVKSVAIRGAAVSGSSLIGWILAQQAWKNVPSWIREDVAVQTLFRSSSKGGNTTTNELSSIASVIEKLQLLLDTGAEKLGRDKIPHLHIAVLLYLQLAGQLKALHPLPRDDRYREAGRLLSDTERDQVAQDHASCLDYAIWAYETDTCTLQDNLGPNFEILQHNSLLDKDTRPGHVGHFVALDKQQQRVVVAIRGTSSLEDLLTDCCGRAVSYQQDGDDSQRVEVRAEQPNEIVLETPLSMEEEESERSCIEVLSGHERIFCVEHDPHSEVRCHEGILISAQRLVRAIEPLIQEWIVEKECPLLVCGHSLGAGVASLVAVVLHAQYPQLHDRIQVVAFAPPPVLDHDSACAASSYTTSIVHNSDIIPRASLANLAVFLEFLRSVSERLQERGLAPVNPTQTATLLRKLLRKDNDKEELLMSLSEVQHAMDRAHATIHLRNRDHLYVPGRVLLYFRPWESAQNELDDAFVCSQSNAVADKLVQYHCIETDGSSSVLRFFEMDGSLSLVFDHATSSYEACTQFQ